jgi:hypothetical protein
MSAGKRSFDCLGFCLNFADTRGARGTTRMLFSREIVCSMSEAETIDAPAKMILVRHQPMQVATNTHSVA